MERVLIKEMWFDLSLPYFARVAEDHTPIHLQKHTNYYFSPYFCSHFVFANRAHCCSRVSAMCKGIISIMDLSALCSLNKLKKDVQKRR